MNMRDRIVNMFLKMLDNNEGLKQHISIEEARKRFNENLREVVYGVDSIRYLGHYNPEEKAIHLIRSIRVKRMNTNAKTAVIHELWHALAVKLDKQNNRDACGIHFTKVEGVTLKENKNAGLDEGITQWLAEKLVGKKESGVLKKLFCSWDWTGIYNIDVEGYGIYMFFAKQLIILCGEETIIKAYLNNDVSIITKVITEKCKIEDADEKFSNYSDMVDKVQCSPKTELRGKFDECQKFFVEEFLEKEIESALQSGDIRKIQEVKKKIEQLLDLNVHEEGKGNIFNEVAKEFNEQVGEEYKVKLKNSRSFILLKFQTKILEVMNFICIPFIKLYDKIHVTIRNRPVKAIANPTPKLNAQVKTNADIVAEIRGSSDMRRSNNEHDIKPNNRTNNRRGGDNRGR